MRRRKFQLTDRMEKKVWEVIQEGSTLTTKLLARRGAPLRTGERELESEEAATKELNRLCAEREDQGWILIESADDTKKKSATETPEEGKHLFQAILNAPDELDAYLVYSDWLTEQGDARGELIAVGVELTKKPKSRTLRARQKEIVEANAHLLLGELANMEGFDATWLFGFLDRVELGVSAPCPLDPSDALEMLFRLMSARLLRGIVFGDFGVAEDLEFEGEADYGPIIEAFTQMPLASVPLRHFAIAPQMLRVGAAEVGDVSPLYEHVPQLEELSLKGTAIELGDVTLPNLRSLEIMTRNPASELITSIKKASWPKLEKLEIDFGQRLGQIVSQEIDGLLESLPAGVTSLGLTGMSFVDDVVNNILSSRTLSQLRSLDLSHGDLTEAGARALVEQKDKLANLKRLDLTRQPLARASVEQLRAAFDWRVKVDEGFDGIPRRPERRADDDDDYYEETVE